MTSHLMPPSHHSSSKSSPAHGSLSLRRSTTSLRGPDTAGGGGGHQVSLAHELAAAMMPEPNLTSQMLADEFGLEFDDGDEGVDGTEDSGGDAFPTADNIVEDPFAPNEHYQDSFQEPSEELHLALNGAGFGATKHEVLDEFDTTFGGPSLGDTDGPEPASIIKDPLKLLAENLEATDVFIGQLRTVDAEPASTMHEPKLEHLAAGILGRLNDVTRERESQVRQMQELDRELKKIVAEVGGNDLLGNLDELEYIEDLVDPSEKSKEAQTYEDVSRTPTATRRSELPVDAETPSNRKRTRGSRRPPTIEEDDDERDQRLLAGDGYDMDQEESYDYDIPSPGKSRKGVDLPPPPPPVDVPTPSATIPHLSHLRNLTQSLVHSLTSLSEHAQVNGVNTADAGRKLRALKNKVVELKADWDSADKSRIKIEKWEAGLIDDLTADDIEDASSPDLSTSSSSRETSPGPDTPELSSAPRPHSRRVDGRKIVEEQLLGFQNALDEAARKTQLIMGR